MPLYKKNYRPNRYQFNISLVEEDIENHSMLNMKDKPAKMILPAFKLLRNYDIRTVDFTNAGFHDDSIRMLSSYLAENPNLRSVVLDQNMFTDDGLKRFADALKVNTKLAHISFRDC